jgi:ElaB/YqjD/DUF883 family membrane-anchored ribosome-binding protein
MEQTNFSSDDSMSGSTHTQSQGQTDTMSNAADTVVDRARDVAASAQDKLADVSGTVRDRAGNLKQSLADALDSGADKLRARSASGAGTQLVANTGTAAVAADGDARMVQVTNRVAGGMEATADWIRDADLDGLKASVEHQVKEHPGPTLLIAAGLGYLIGKALRK